MSSTTEAPFSKASDVLWNVVGRRKWVFRDAFFATLIINTLALATALFTMQVYDRVIPHTGFETLLVLGAGVMLALLFDLILKQVRSHMMDREGTQIDIELSDWFFRRAQGVRMEARPPSLGTLAAQLKGLEYLRGVFGSSSIFVVVDVPFAFFFIGVIAYLAGPLAIVPLVLVPVALLVGILSQRRVSKAIAANQGHQNEKAGMLVEAIDGVENIKATGNDAAIAGAWQELLDKAGADDDRIKAASAMSSNVTATLQQISYVLLIAFGAVLAVRGELSMGALIACAIISQRALSPIARFPSVLVQWEHARAALRNLDQLLSLPNEQDEHDRNLAPEVLDNSLKLDRVRFAYGDNDHLAIDIPKLEIAPGERVAIVGAIGSGKSTLLKVASGLFRPREGHVYLGGLDVAHIRTDCLRQRIAYLPQDLRLTHGTLRQNLLRGISDPGDEAILEAARKTGLIDLINGHPLGLALPITEGGRGISGGQRQLIGITRLLLVDPGVLLLDEPSAAMDATTEARVIQLLKSMGEQGRTIVVSTHKGTLLPLVDRVVVFANGRIVTDGPRQQVMAELARKRSQGVSTEERKAV
ncbi:ATP-binding cassette domain-containing protein [Thioalkalivibrio sp. AKL12]|uniref:ATP-binding cassette domain-containing protein n=1 Tax=Thioalkalivibrio sp. AKL12 TaxID=1158159 RepID=UPI000477D227|nr:ATP-binding cassette domain-containing protein [Thioalkalivibrio sp. AKL12]